MDVRAFRKSSASEGECGASTWGCNVRASAVPKETPSNKRRILACPARTPAMTPAMTRRLQDDTKYDERDAHPSGSSVKVFYYA